MAEMGSVISYVNVIKQLPYVLVSTDRVTNYAFSAVQVDWYTKSTQHGAYAEVDKLM